MPSAPADTSDTKRILVVDDNEDIREFLVEFLVEHGHHVEGVGSAEAAELSLAAEPFDVLLTDVGLPGVSGIELAERALTRAPQLHVILATGLTREALKPHAALLARATVLIKPYDEAAVLRAINRD